jgi:hypothetical protein
LTLQAERRQPDSDDSNFLNASPDSDVIRIIHRVKFHEFESGSEPFQWISMDFNLKRLEGHQRPRPYYMEGGTMFDINTEIEILECCASECALISNLATDQRARRENGELASEYRQRAENLKTYAHLMGTSKE